MSINPQQTYMIRFKNDEAIKAYEEQLRYYESVLFAGPDDNDNYVADGDTLRMLDELWELYRVVIKGTRLIPGRELQAVKMRNTDLRMFFDDYFDCAPYDDTRPYEEQLREFNADKPVLFRSWTCG